VFECGLAGMLLDDISEQFAKMVDVAAQLFIVDHGETMAPWLKLRHVQIRCQAFGYEEIRIDIAMR